MADSETMTRKVLIIEDSISDTLLFREAIHDCGMDMAVTIVPKWSDAQSILTDTELSLIMLDLNLPGIGGMEILQLIRESREDRIPIIVFSTSSSPSDIQSCYRGGANGYITKPYDVDDLFHTMCSTFKWWLEVNKLWDELYD